MESPEGERLHVSTIDTSLRAKRAVARLAAAAAVVLATTAGWACADAERPAAEAGQASPNGGQALPDAGQAPFAVAEQRSWVRPGAEVLLADSLALVAGRRVGLITNHTGLARDGTSTIDLLAAHPQVTLTALFSPEHGIRGRAEAGARVEDGVDPSTGLPVHSLYGESRKPTPETLAELDVLLFDIQDVGARYYTYLSTMTLAMEAAGERGIPFVVLDRPNPVGGSAVQGNVLDPAFASFVGLYPVPMRHGLTAGEFARMAAGEFGVAAQLAVVPAEGWRRDMTFEETGLPWVPPSPNMPSVESALHYPGTCLFEGTSISVGRGTPRAFQQVGAPWLDGEALAARLTALHVPDAVFVPARFTPVDPGDGKFDGEASGGVRLVADGPRYDPTLAALALLAEIKAASGEHWGWHESHFDRLAGTDALRGALDAGAGYTELAERWGANLPAFAERRRPYLLYR